MHLRSFLLIIFCIGINHTKAQNSPGRPAILWQKWFGGAGIDRANDVIFTADGGMIMAGTSSSNDGDVTGSHGGFDGWVIKLNAAGQKQWQRAVGGTANEGFKTIIKCSTGGYLCIGYTSSNDGDISNLHNPAGSDYKRDCWVVKLSDSGVVQWSRAFGGSRDDEANSCIEASDGNYVITGSTRSSDGDVHVADTLDDNDAWIFKINANGNMLWENSIDQGGRYAHFANAGINLIETAGQQLLAYTAGYRIYDTTFITPSLFVSDEWDTTTVSNVWEKVGVLYKININNGIAEYYTTIEGDDSHSMKQSPEGIYFSYMKYRFRLYDEYDPGQGYCLDEEATLASLDTNTGNIVHTRTFLERCEDAGSTMHSRFFPAGPAGTDRVEGGPWVQAGSRFMMSGCGGDDNDGYFILAGTGGFFYGGTAADVFNAVKAYPNGHEFICAGYTGSVDLDLEGHGPAQLECQGVPLDFWVVKLSTSTNQITGNVFLDENNNNVKDSAEQAFTKGVVQINKPGYDVSFGINGGHFKAVVDIGNFTSKLNLYNSSHFTVSPLSAASAFNSSNGIDTIDFAVHKIDDFADNAVSFFLSGNTVRPATVAGYRIQVANNGTVALLNRQLTLIKDHRLQFSNASLAPVHISGDTIVWNIDSVAVDGTKLVQVNLLADNTPYLNIGDTVYSSILLDSTSDDNVNDNIASLKQAVINSFDPNDKQEIHGGKISKLEVKNGHYFTYTIRFQNTGNDTAFNIIVKDALDEKLGAASIEMVSASHPYQLTIKDGKYISWEFSNVLLVDSLHNEPASHGYITYRIKPKNTLVTGDVINNSASIYFDFNEPVKTNIQSTEITKTIAVWTGVKNTSWEDPANWNIKAVPDDETIVIVPAAVLNYPVVNSNAVCAALRVDNNAAITVNAGFNIDVTGK